MMTVTSFPGFWSVFGLIGCLVIIVVSKWMGKLFLQKDEHYYSGARDGSQSSGSLPNSREASL